MLKIKEELLKILLELKEQYGLISVKAEFEAEGSRLDELVMLNEVVFRADVDLNIKIGGCEAIRDLDQCRLLGAAGIMVPMIETPFAMKKFCDAGRTVYSDWPNIEWIMNAETITCYDNFHEILQAAKGFIQTVVIGRSDLTASMGLSRDEIDGDAVFQKVESFAKMSREAGLKVAFGGGVSVSSIPFLMKLADKIDQFETRKVVLPIPPNAESAEKMIEKALEFELCYLKYKSYFYKRMATEDAGRIYALEERLKKNGMKLR